MNEDSYITMEIEPQEEYTEWESCPCGAPLWECETYEDCSEYN